ncbi:hypothetical protein [Amycolatopsis sp. WQ 127309]|uniref:hypothetical protein n=1 Tax=Amycolatopsis sp. WQ 127309 TaxID=2932773 RepID=UPI001FF5065E|nr:hypothetical protein [Amycolatopsis sp. WQ 127309]UOZ03503.1 hypothetical protein MUY22_32195 [Amycolatopsis sp. WQ 127309]
MGNLRGGEISDDGRVTSREQDAVRILLLIDGAAEPLPAPIADDTALASAVGVVESQVRLQKLDFWVRNPDFLADELLNDFEESREPRLLELAGQILDSEEPEVRRYPMLRHHFGAYEPLDDALAVLRAAGLVVRRRRGTLGRTSRHDYYLLQRGREVARTVIAEAPPFRYYVERIDLVLDLADGRGGNELKERQYLQAEYAAAERGTRIGSISVRARERLTVLRSANLTLGREEGIG